MRLSLLLLITCIGLISCKNEQKNAVSDTFESRLLEINEMIAIVHGIEHWNKVEEIKFSFNVLRGEAHSMRTWIWKPKTDDITLIRDNDTINFNRNRIDSLSINADRAFINDKYWLLAPYNLVWDTGTTFTQIDSAVAPISKKSMQQLTIVYGDEGGYTPGDAYDFYFDNDFMIKEWVFRRNNDTIPSLITTWEDYEIYNGIIISKLRQTEDQSFKLYFTNIEVKTTHE